MTARSNENSEMLVENVLSFPDPGKIPVEIKDVNHTYWNWLLFLHAISILKEFEINTIDILSSFMIVEHSGPSGVENGITVYEKLKMLFKDVFELCEVQLRIIPYRNGVNQFFLIDLN
ncbi:MAG: hypothetical protein ACFFD4_18170 [Candidatus Odinarchaeota archaeon]